MGEPNLPAYLGALPRSPQIDGIKDYAKGVGEIDDGGVSQTHKGYGRRGRNQPLGMNIPTAPARYTKDDQ